MEGFSLPHQRSDRVVLEANLDYWDASRLPRLQRIIFENTLEQQDAVELVKTREGRVDVVTGLRPLDTLRVAQSPFAMVVKDRGSPMTVFGMFNMRKAGSPWHDIRLRRAVNLAINRADFIRYATKGNGVVLPALLPPSAFGYDPNLPPYPFDPTQARQLLREAGYSTGLAVTLIAPRTLEVQATVVSKMLQQAGFAVELQVLDTDTYHQKTFLSHLDQPAKQQPWDIALTSTNVNRGPLMRTYNWYALDGVYDWVMEAPTLRQLYARVLSTVDPEQQQHWMRQMERHIRDQAYFLFLYNPIRLYAVNKAVQLVPYAGIALILHKTAVTEQHWSVRKQKATGHK